MKRLLLFIPVILAVTLGMVLFAGIGKDPSHLESALIGKPVPAFELTNLLAPGEQLDEQVFKGQVSLLNVWGTWCPACRDEHGELVRLARSEGVRIVGLNYKDQRDLALQWLSGLGNPYAVTLYDPAGRVGFDLGVYGAPETYVIDGDGIVRFRHVGVVTEQVWRELLEPVVRQYQEQG
ncbi:DsbE family thiol:disulfide interchange protein [Marinobacter sp. X15-166B]|uniref:DsbE family thiol:disulfide interchange protein n=1 Tax=Marinobacter sp. X15-166B TaxID=1897620 RepID=UPI00085C9332|nr:DsbE family thiol:disulfide interchange protein [Marinobacter sp. X15-166B]OEY67099.1 thiol:disulfide interchange protein [Marinobacter sp. X15-166B]